MYDIIGDIHGHADELEELLYQLEYRCDNGVYWHPNRTAIFLGDFVDRGPQILRVLQITYAMCQRGSALAVVGNHELNALAYHTPDPSKPGRYLRKHTCKNIEQHSETLKQVPHDEMRYYLEWFRQLPMWLQLEGIRVVHACWDLVQIGVIGKEMRPHSRCSSDFIRKATAEKSELYQAVEDVLKGKEVELPDGRSFKDGAGHDRPHVRVRWFRSPEGMTYRSYSLPQNDAAPDEPIPKDKTAAIRPYSPDADPIFFGHYWLRMNAKPKLLAPNVACLDYSIAKSGDLCAYRWDGEQQLSEDKFVWACSRPAG